MKEIYFSILGTFLGFYLPTGQKIMFIPMAHVNQSFSESLGRCSAPYSRESDNPIKDDALSGTKSTLK